jgi:glycosyltransferase involved in cell wall biosynthesis
VNQSIRPTTLKILFVINAPIVGGAERHTFGLAEGLKTYQFESRAFAMKGGENEAALLGVSKMPILTPGPGYRLTKRIRELADEIDSGEYDLVIGVNERPILAAFLARLQCKTKKRPAIVGVLHSTVLRNLRETLIHIGHFPVFYGVDDIVFISARQREFWLRRGMRPRRKHTILNGIDVDRFCPTQRQLHREATRTHYGFAPDDYVVGLCAMLRSEKNPLQLVETVARLRQDGVPAKALIVGEGAMRRQVEERIASLNLQDTVVLAGLVKDVRPLAAAMDVGVLCSTSIETLSLAALELMAMNVPMVMSDIGGASEIVDGRNGRLFPVGDDDAFKAALKDLWAPETRDAAAQAARDTVERKFTHGQMVSDYASLLRAIVARRGRAMNAPPALSA